MAVLSKELKEKLVELSVCNILAEHTLRTISDKTNNIAHCLEKIANDKQIVSLGKSNLDTSSFRVSLSTANQLSAQAFHELASMHIGLNGMAIELFGEDQLKEVVATALEDPRVIALDGGGR